MAERYIARLEYERQTFSDLSLTTSCAPVPKYNKATIFPVGCVHPLANCTFRCPSLGVTAGGEGGGGPQVNKFEQVSSDDHQMPITG